jgi:hypothetical protein
MRPVVGIRKATTCLTYFERVGWGGASHMLSAWSLTGGRLACHGGKIDMAARRQVTNKLRDAYCKGSKAERGRILDRVVEATGMGRSTARRMLRGPRLAAPAGDDECGDGGPASATGPGPDAPHQHRPSDHRSARHRQDHQSGIIAIVNQPIGTRQTQAHTRSQRVRHPQPSRAHFPVRHLGQWVAGYLTAWHNRDHDDGLAAEREGSIL